MKAWTKPTITEFHFGARDMNEHENEVLHTSRVLQHIKDITPNIQNFNAECRGLIEISPFVDEENAAQIVAMLRITSVIEKLIEAPVRAASAAHQAAEDALELLEKVAEYERRLP